MMVGVNVSDDLTNVTGAQPFYNPLRCFSSVPGVLPRDADYPRDIRDPTSLLVNDGCLHGPHRLVIGKPSNNPVEPRFPRLRRAGRELLVPSPKVVLTCRAPANELMEPFVGKCVGHLTGVIGSERPKDQSLGCNG